VLFNKAIGDEREIIVPFHEKRRHRKGFVLITDNVPQSCPPYVTYSLLALNVVVFLLVKYGSCEYLEEHFQLYLREFQYRNLFTTVLLHGDFPHLMANCFWLYLIGRRVESYLGHVRFFILYFISAAFGNLLVMKYFYNSDIVIEGSSGAVFGLFGAYMILYPYAEFEIWPLSNFSSKGNPSAYTVLGIMYSLQFRGFYNNYDPAALDHLGGFLMGAFITYLFVMVEYIVNHLLSRVLSYKVN
jgi:rhomboid protease GluP